MSRLDGTRDDEALRALMRGYQGGDMEAFAEMYGRVQPGIRAALARHGRSATLLDDLVQETFLQIHRARHTYDPSYPVMPWVVAIARHVALMHDRAARRRPQATDAIDAVTVVVPAEAERFPVRAAVRDALASLPATRRRPVVWHHVAGLSFREIGQRLGVGEDAAKLRSSRGMAALRARLAATFPGKGRQNA